MIIERAAILSERHGLDLAGAMGERARAQTRHTTPEPSVATANEIMPLDEAMRRYIEKALAATEGQVGGESGAAERLGLHPSTLRGRMRRLGIDWSRYRSR